MCGGMCTIVIKEGLGDECARRVRYQTMEYRPLHVLLGLGPWIFARSGQA